MLVNSIEFQIQLIQFMETLLYKLISKAYLSVKLIRDTFSWKYSFIFSSLGKYIKIPLVIYYGKHLEGND